MEEPFRLASAWVMRASTPFDLPRSKSNGTDQMSRLTSRFVNATAPAAEHAGSFSLPEPVEILLKIPVTFPVSADRPASHRFRTSAALFSIEKMTLLEAADQQPGIGTCASGKDDDSMR